MDLKNLKEINNETLTKVICNKGFIGNLNNLSRTNFSVVGQVSSPQSLTAHSLDRYAQAEKTERN